MRIRLDENLPAELVEDLAAKGHDVDSVASERLVGRADPVVVAAARKSHRILFTLDKGLGDVRRFPPSQQRGIVLFRTSQRGRRAVRTFIKSAMERLPNEADITGNLIVVSESAVRMRRRSP